LHLDARFEREAEERRAIHFEEDPIEDHIRAFLNTSVPKDWYKFTRAEQQAFLSGGLVNQKDLEVFPRDRITASEIWQDCLGETRTISQKDARRINVCLRRIKGWEETANTVFGSIIKRGFIRNRLW
jgi:hypothetical protein